jgi:hypothetical protein
VPSRDSTRTHQKAKAQQQELSRSSSCCLGLYSRRILHHNNASARDGTRNLIMRACGISHTRRGGPTTCKVRCKFCSYFANASSLLRRANADVLGLWLFVGRV